MWSLSIIKEYAVSTGKESESEVEKGFKVVSRR